MNVWRRVRGLLGATITWGVVGAFVGAAMFMVRYQPWSVGPEARPRAAQLLGAFLGGGALWGSACGLAFGLVVSWAGRRRGVTQLSSKQFMLWGAVGGAAFPLLLFTPAVAFRGASDSIPLYGSITAISALLGTGLGRVLFAMATRAPSVATPAALAGVSAIGESEVSLKARDRVR